MIVCKPPPIVAWRAYALRHQSGKAQRYLSPPSQRVARATRSMQDSVRRANPGRSVRGKRACVRNLRVISVYRYRYRQCPLPVARDGSGKQTPRGPVLYRCCVPAPPGVFLPVPFSGIPIPRCFWLPVTNHDRSHTTRIRFVFKEPPACRIRSRPQTTTDQRFSRSHVLTRRAF